MKLNNETVTVELKNDVCIRGILKSVDQYLNIKLDDAEVTDERKWPHLVRTYTRCILSACGLIYGDEFLNC